MYDDFAFSPIFSDYLLILSLQNRCWCDVVVSGLSTRAVGCETLCHDKTSENSSPRLIVTRAVVWCNEWAVLFSSEICVHI